MPVGELINIMSTDQKSVQSKAFLEQNAIHDQWQSDYLNPDLNRFYDLAFADILRVLKPTANDKILDAGCGACYHTVRLARCDARITAVDFSHIALDTGRHTIAEAGIDHRVELRQADLTSLPFDDGSFDFVVSWGVIMHVPEMEKALAELARVLKSGGVLVLCENNLHSFDVAVRERLVRVVKKLIGRTMPEIRTTPRGSEAWSQSNSGGLMVRKTDMRFLSSFLASIGLAEILRTAGQFTEAYTNVGSRRLKRLVYAVNMLYYKLAGLPAFAMGNILYFRKK
jgi:ubiquinone/menaquinone biosynthesis C-methylase UbiE